MRMVVPPARKEVRVNDLRFFRYRDRCRRPYALRRVLMREVHCLAVGHAAQQSEDVWLGGVDKVIHRSIGHAEIGAVAMIAAGRGVQVIVEHQAPARGIGLQPAANHFAGDEERAGAADSPPVFAAGGPIVEPLKLAGHERVREPVRDIARPSALVHPAEDARQVRLRGLDRRGGSPDGDGRRPYRAGDIAVGVGRLGVVIGAVAIDAIDIEGRMTSGAAAIVGPAARPGRRQHLLGECPRGEHDCAGWDSRTP